MDLPPEIPPAEMAEEELDALIDAGNVQAVEAALREHNVRVPAVIRQLDRTLDQKRGNLAAVLATMLISRFHVAQANLLAQRVLREVQSAGVEELVDLAAALFQQERLAAARTVLEAAISKNENHDRALYFTALLHARSGDALKAFETISRSSPKLLGSHGLASQARYAAWAGKPKAHQGALKLARKALSKESSSEERAEAELQIQSSEVMANRLNSLELQDSTQLNLTNALMVEYGSLLIERSTRISEHGVFDGSPISYADAGRLIRRIHEVIVQTGKEVQELVYANEDGEVVAAGLSQLLGKPYRAWHKDLNAKDGDWLCMGSAATHPHLQNEAVQSLDRALKAGVLRSLCLVLPRGWRAPVVPDLIGRITEDDEFPWESDDEIEDSYDEMLNEDPTENVAQEDFEQLLESVNTNGKLLRSLQDSPRSGHLAYRDETPISGGR